MCGFAGEFLFEAPGANVETVRNMAESLAHRGPDQAGSFLSPDGRCAIGFRRLAIIDPTGSHQPMTTPDGARTVAFNGEIYNFPQLRAELTGRGVTFRTKGDTEVLLHLPGDDPAEMLNRLDGMFALAIYDATEPTLLLARDRFGQKPLWYSYLSDRIVFASEPRGVLAHPLIHGRIDMCSIQHYLTMGYVPGHCSAWQNIHKLQPGQYLRIARSAAQPVRYWQLTPQNVQANERDLVADVRSQVISAVEARMVSDVPLGALLSGGLDSAIVTAVMSKSAGRTGGIRTFTAGFADQAYDERSAAAAVAKHCNTDHTELLIEPDPLTALDMIVDMYDEPFGDSSALPTHLICRAAREHVTVALTGDGGDEAFGGYDRYRAMQIAENLSPLAYTGFRLAASLARPFAPHRERNRLRRLIRFADALHLPPAVQYFQYRSLFDPSDLDKLFSDNTLTELDLDAPLRWFCDLFDAEDLPDEPSRAQYHDLHTYLPDDLLVKADIASMACSLELRAPLLDHRVVQLGLSLPTALKVGRRQGKLILRQAFADMLPAEALSAPKRGFGIPLASWLRNELRTTLIETLGDSGFLGRGIFRPEAVLGLVDEHLHRRADHSHRLWALLVLARWLDKWA